MGWGYWGGSIGNYTGGGGGSFPFAPAVDKWKWLDQRRMTLVSDRWAKNKTNDLQAAYFNGVGYEAWENIWGIWNGITPRDGEALRRAAHILRYFGRRGFTQSTAWEPHTPSVAHSEQVFASKWPLKAETLWTLVNRGSSDVTGVQLVLNASEYVRVHVHLFKHAQLEDADGRHRYVIRHCWCAFLISAPLDGDGSLGIKLR